MKEKVPELWCDVTRAVKQLPLLAKRVDVQRAPHTEAGSSRITHHKDDERQRK